MRTVAFQWQYQPLKYFFWGGDGKRGAWWQSQGGEGYNSITAQYSSTAPLRMRALAHAMGEHQDHKMNLNKKNV